MGCGNEKSVMTELKTRAESLEGQCVGGTKDGRDFSCMFSLREGWVLRVEASMCESQKYVSDMKTLMRWLRKPVLSINRSTQPEQPMNELYTSLLIH